MAWWFYAILSAFFAALTAIFSKMGVATINSNLATGIRTIIILLLISCIVFIRGEAKGIESIPKRELFFLILSGVATGLSWLFYYKALQMGDVSKVASIDKLSLAITVILAVVFLGEAFSWKLALGATLIVAGTLVMMIK